jgi:hypothetical protein
MKEKSKLIDHIAKTIKNGDVKTTFQDGVVVKVSFRVNDKENILTLEDLKGE